MENIRLKSELSNTMYEVVDEMLNYMNIKQGYKKNDTIKLITAISQGKYKFITNDNDYRQQVKLLSDYFKKEHNHLLINFILMKNMLINRDNEIINELIKSNDVKENLIYLLEKEDYDEILSLIESNKKVFLVFAKTYEKYRKGMC